MSDPAASHPIPVPKELVNDDAYLVIALLAEPGTRVARDQPLAELETSKAAFTLTSPADGFFFPEYATGEMVPVGASFGTIRPTPLKDTPAAAEEKPAWSADTPDNRFSLPAWELFRQSGLPLDAFAGMAHVKRGDVERMSSSPAAGSAPEWSAPPDSDKEGLVVLLGGGGHCRECIEIVEQEGRLAIAGVIDTRAAPGSLIAGYPVLGDNTRLEGLRNTGVRNLILAYGMAGSQRARGEHFRELLALGHRFPAIVHPKAAVNRHARLGQGAQIMAGSLVGSQAAIGDACIVNSNAVVSHDCVLGSNVHVAPGALLAGGVNVGDDTVVGMGTTVYMRVRIGRGAVIHNGADVFTDVPDGMEVRGEWRGAKQR